MKEIKPLIRDPHLGLVGAICLLLAAFLYVTAVIINPVSTFTEPTLIPAKRHRLEPVQTWFHVMGDDGFALPAPVPPVGPTASKATAIYVLIPRLVAGAGTQFDVRGNGYGIAGNGL